MRGIQLSFLRVDEDERSWWLHLIDAPTTAPMWPSAAFYKSGRITPDKLSDEDYRWKSHFEAKGPKLDDLGQKAVLAAIRGAADALEEKVDHLNDLDSGCGDGDCGSTLGRWVTAVGEMELHPSHPHTLLEQLSWIFESKVGGTTGALYGIFFAAAASAFRGSEDDEITSERWLTAGRHGLAAVMKYSKGEPGDRSLVSFTFDKIKR